MGYAQKCLTWRSGFFTMAQQAEKKKWHDLSPSKKRVIKNVKWHFSKDLLNTDKTHNRMVVKTIWPMLDWLLAKMYVTTEVTTTFKYWGRETLEYWSDVCAEHTVRWKWKSVSLHNSDKSSIVHQVFVRVYLDISLRNGSTPSAFSKLAQNGKSIYWKFPQTNSFYLTNHKSEKIQNCLNCAMYCIVSLLS